MSQTMEKSLRGSKLFQTHKSCEQNNEMDLNLVSPSDEPQVNKLLYDLKGVQRNGLMLQIHPTSLDTHGEIKKSRFLHCSFSENNVLAVSDNNGNVFIVDLEVQKYWQIPHKGSVTAISFIPVIKSTLLIALSIKIIQIVHIETGNVIGILTGHTAPAKEASYTNDGKYCLTCNSIEAIIWDLVTYSQAHKLSLKDDMLLKKALFIPMQESIFACFQDDAMNIWKFPSFECVKQIIPEGWKTHHLKSVAFTQNGGVMVIGGYTQHIVVFCVDTWTLKKIIELPDSIHGIKLMEFVQQTHDRASKILGIVTNNSELYFINIESSLILNYISPSNQLVGYFSASPAGKYLACIQLSGEIEIYLTDKFVLPSQRSLDCIQWTSSKPRINEDVPPTDSVINANQKLKQKWLKELKDVHDELKEELNLKKLLPILKQFGEYPESYRIVIWRTILQLPMNKQAYKSLASKECHPSYGNIESNYPLVNTGLSNTWKRVLSSLAYWCPLFSEVTFLPEFAFPFVKLLHCDPFICFETIATIIVNWYQNWFEFYPFPPINVLSMVENVLGYHDPDLLEFYYKKNITSRIYACLLMETAFSEVLAKQDWLRLWDHILSNEPSFIFMAIVAYNVICRTPIKNCETYQNVEDFFRSQQTADVKLVISKTYNFLEKTQPDIHPRRYLSPFSPLKKGTTYMPYEAYPKLILDRNAAKLQLMQKEEQNILQEQQKTIAMKKELEEKLRHDHESDFREQVFAELDEKFREIVTAEEERISMQRKKLQCLRNEVKLKELAVLEEVRDEMLKKRNQKKEIEMERLLKDIESRKARENEELEALEEEVQRLYSSLLLHKYRLKLDLEMKEEEDIKNVSEELIVKRDKLKQEFDELQDELSLSYHDKRIEIVKKIGKITEILKNIEEELDDEIVGDLDGAQLGKNNLAADYLLRKTKLVEKKLEGLLNTKTRSAASTHEKQDESASNEKTNACVATSGVIAPVSQPSKENNFRWFFETPVEKNPTKFKLFDVEDETSGDGELLDKNRNKINDDDEEKISRFLFKYRRGGARSRKKLQFRTKFSQCCSTPPSTLSSESKPSNSSASESEEDYISQKKRISYRGFRKRRLHGRSRGDDETNLQKLRDENLTRGFAFDFYEKDSASCVSDCTNELMKMALSERRKLIEGAKERHFSSV